MSSPTKSAEPAPTEHVTSRADRLSTTVGTRSRLLATAFDFLVIAGWAGFAAIAGVIARLIGADFETVLFRDVFAFFSLVLPVVLTFAYQEASPMQASFGKRRLGLRVVDRSGERISFRRALSRSAAKFLPWQLAHTAVFGLLEGSTETWLISLSLTAQLIVIVSVIAMTVDGRHRALHDWVASTLVVPAEQANVLGQPHELRGTDAPTKPSRKKWIVLALIAAVLGAYGYLSLPGWMLRLSGDMVDIGGRSLFISCQGSGTPTVILEHGLGTNGTDWEAVQDELATDTRVCFSSRAGMGLSEPIEGAELRTAQDAVDDLASLLDAADVPGPYILVGHSFGGFIVRMFTDQHPDDVVGMVLVDTSHEDQFRLFEERLSPETWAEFSGFFGPDNPEHMDLLASSAEMANAGNLGDLPLVVIRADPETIDAEAMGIAQAAAEDIDRIVSELGPVLQRELADLSTNSRLIFADGSSHYVHVDRPELVIEAIRSLLDR